MVRYMKLLCKPRNMLYDLDIINPTYYVFIVKIYFISKFSDTLIVQNNITKQMHYKNLHLRLQKLFPVAIFIGL